AVVAWPAGPDLHATVYFNQRRRPEHPPGSIEPERLRAALEARLGEEIRRLAPSLDAAAYARAAELGRVEARLFERPPSREQAAPVPERRQEPAGAGVAAAIVVAVDREHEHEASAAASGHHNDRQEGVDARQ